MWVTVGRRKHQRVGDCRTKQALTCGRKSRRKENTNVWVIVGRVGRRIHQRVCVCRKNRKKENTNVWMTVGRIGRRKHQRVGDCSIGREGDRELPTRRATGRGRRGAELNIVNFQMSFRCRVQRCISAVKAGRGHLVLAVEWGGARRRHYRALRPPFVRASLLTAHYSSMWSYAAADKKFLFMLAPCCF